MDRRQWLRLVSAGSCAATLATRRSLASPKACQHGVVIATWPFGLEACQKSYETLIDPARKGKPQRLLDAVEAGIRVTESDPANRWVGIGGYPNAEGGLQLEACIMDGQRPRQRSGSVAGLVGYGHPISVARKVMEETPHAIFVGEDAARFAKDQGCETAQTPHPDALQAWKEWKAKQAEGKEAPKVPGQDHDTITLLAWSPTREIAGGCSTSGLAFKMPGRVGDSPIVGGGLYVDPKVGAAGATGTGENILRYCGSFLAVEKMRQGATPEQALREVIARIAEGEQRPPSELSINFLAIDQQGNFAAVGTDADFQISVVSDGEGSRQPAIRIV